MNNNIQDKKIIGYDPNTGVPIYQEENIQSTYNQVDNKSYQVLQNNKQNNSSSLPVFLVIMAIIFIVIALFFLISSSLDKLSYKPNKGIDNFKLYVPETWKFNEENSFYISPSEQCRVFGGTINKDIEYVKTAIIEKFDGYDITFTDRKINGYEWEYLYTDDGKTGVYIYLISNDLGDYMTMFLNDFDGEDEECNTYVDILEKSMTLK